MEEARSTPVVDATYRNMVAEALGAHEVRLLSEDTLAAAERLARTAGDTAAEVAWREAHRLVGGSGSLGLAALSQALRSLEQALDPGAPGGTDLNRRCSELLRQVDATRAALALQQV